MAEKFDAYYKWLSIPPEQQPPHFYQLLGIPALTDDLDVIESAADRQAAHVRKHLDGQHRGYAEKLLQHIEMVKACLLDLEKKAEYDAALKQRIAAATAAGAIAKPQAKPAAAKPRPRSANATANDGHAPDDASVVAPQPRRAIVVVGVAAVILLICGVAATLYFLRDRGPATATSKSDALRPVPPKAQRKPSTVQPAIPSPASPPDSPPDASPASDAADSVATATEVETTEAPVAPADPPVTPPMDPASDVPPTPTDPEPSLPADPPSPSDPEPPPRLAPPTEEAQQAKIELIRELFKSDYDRATTPQAATALANMLIEQGDQSGEDPDGRFCLYREARDVAVKAADLETALLAIDKVSADYEIDQWQMKVAALDDGAGEVRGSESVDAFVETCFQLLDETLADDRYDVAERIVAAAGAAGRKTSDVGLKKEIAERRRSVNGMKQDFERVAEALAVLDQNPNDGDANLTAGRYFCFHKNDWRRGLPMLAAGSDAELAAQARAELDAPSQADAELGVAEGWWTLGENEKDPVQQNIFRHASELVRTHWSSLDGLAKVKWEKRLQDAMPEQVARADDPPIKAGGDEPADTRKPPGQLPGTVPDHPAYKDVLSVVDSYERIYRQRKRANYQPRVFEAEKDFKHGTGDKVEDGWIAVPGRANPNKALMYGPFLTDVPVGGPHMATFRMMFSGQINPRNPVVSIDVVDANSNTALISQSVELGTTQPGQYFEVGLPFFCPAGHRIEFRAWWKDNGAVKIDRVTLSPAPILIPNAWYTTFYAWPKWSGVPDKRDWQTILQTRPIGQRVLSHLGLYWRFPLQGPVRPFAAVANTVIELPAGRYEMSIIADDGARAFLDGREVIEDWWPHGSRRESALVTVSAGKHAIRVEYCNGPGVGQIQCWFRPVAR